MNPGQANRLLGIKSGADVPAIRKAYAAKLKALDVDAEPQAYAALRQARDLALRLAKAAQAAEAPEPETAAPASLSDDPAEPPREWPYAAPLRPDLADQDMIPIHLVGQAEIPPRQERPEPVELRLPDFSPAVERAFAGPPQLARGGHAAADGVALSRPDRDLYTLLSAGEDAPLDEAELARANGWLGQILADAASADLTLHGQIEGWLADTIARAWPRSAPLLPPTAEAFGWENERGQLHERSSIAWLNARLRGFRFQSDVVDPAHRFHKAWVELHQPGRSTVLQRLRVNRPDVIRLLKGVRENFPELEDHFDPQRVASWEGGGGPSISFAAGRFAEGANARFPMFAVWTGILFMIQVVRFIPGLNSDARPDKLDGQFGPPAAVATADPDYERIRDAAVIAAFGEGKTIAWLREHQASLSASFEARIRAARNSGADEAAAIAQAVDFVHRRVFLAGRREKGATLDDTMAVHLAYLDAASKLGSATCLQSMHSLDFGGVSIPTTVRRQEAKLASRLAEAGKLVEVPASGPSQASVPGELVGQIIRATGLTQSQVGKALQERASAEDNCAVKRALLRAALDWNGPERNAIFLTI
ncbi:hypothetical protein H7F51_17515 [Novosphingobium flavum]|uniref:J domain-containing protein n=1 Tax=Novosphingobium flavum TaxID=1778672 RepID=A0A7X1KNG2_9SPHN|nr:hypothetical protein [Novosphingobium flavum]MBC2667320.1 hypothetical protein [Novosphingobium flavum]